MYKKYIGILLLVLSVLLAASGCSYVSHKDYYSDLDDYSEIWELTGVRYSYKNTSSLFPENIENLSVKNFFCRYDQQLPLGEGMQVLLEIQYTDEDMFIREVEDISSISFSCDDYFPEIGFSAYAIRLGADSSSEYALIDEENQTVYYIYLQNIPQKEIEIDHKFLPAGYTEFGEIITN